jgi:hypothetical protein
MPETKTWGSISLLVGHYYKLELKMSKLEAPILPIPLDIHDVNPDSALMGLAQSLISR